MMNVIQDLKNSKIVFLLSRLFLGGLFIYSGLLKIINAEAFHEIFNSSFIPAELIPAVAAFLPVLEFVLGATVVLNVFLKETVYLIIFLLVVFIFYIGLHLITSQYSGCGCFSLDNASPKSFLDGIGVIVRDIFLILISVNMIGHVKKGGK